jgi:adenosine deaminase
MDRKEWIHALPKAEYHLHLEGAVPWQMVQQAEGELLGLEPLWFDSNYRYSDFTVFQDALSSSIRHVLKGVDDFRKVAAYNFQKLQEQNVYYVEISVSLGGLIRRGIVCEDVLEAIRSAAPVGMTVAVFIGFGRKDSFSEETLADVLRTPHLAGIDIYGDERIGSLEPYIELYKEARWLGLRTKAHAGELLGASAIHETLDKLEPERIQHGITAASDKELLKRLADSNISLDLCPTSNLMLNVVSEMRDYPIRAFLDAGVHVTLNTDDPAMFNCTMSSELITMLEYKLITASEIAAMQHQAFDKALMGDVERIAAQAKIAELVKSLDNANDI